MSHDVIYRVQFHNQDKVYTLHARYLYPSDLYGFIQIEDLIFREQQYIIDPQEKKLQQEFSGVSSSYLPMHQIIRIDQIDLEQSHLSEYKKTNPFSIAK